MEAGAGEAQDHQSGAGQAGRRDAARTSAFADALVATARSRCSRTARACFLSRRTPGRRFWSPASGRRRRRRWDRTSPTAVSSPQVLDTGFSPSPAQIAAGGRRGEDERPRPRHDLQRLGLAGADPARERAAAERDAADRLTRSARRTTSPYFPSVSTFITGYDYQPVSHHAAVRAMFGGDSDRRQAAGDHHRAAAVDDGAVPVRVRPAPPEVGLRPAPLQPVVRLAQRKVLSTDAYCSSYSSAVISPGGEPAGLAPHDDRRDDSRADESGSKATAASPVAAQPGPAKRSSQDVDASVTRPGGGGGGRRRSRTR